MAAISCILLIFLLIVCDPAVARVVQLDHLLRAVSLRPSSASLHNRLAARLLLSDRHHDAKRAAVAAEFAASPLRPLHFINLDRDAERRHHIRSLAMRLRLQDGGIKLVRHPGVDGAGASITDDIAKMFRDTDFGRADDDDLDRGVLGCALSHLSLWRQIARGDDGWSAVVEDDVELHPDFPRLLRERVALLAAADPQWMFLALNGGVNGTRPWETDYTRLSPVRRGDRAIPGLFRVDVEMWLPTTMAYALSRRGAQRLVELAERQGIHRAVDFWVLDFRSTLRLYAAFPPQLVRHNCTFGSSIADVGKGDLTVHARHALFSGCPPRARRVSR